MKLGKIFICINILVLSLLMLTGYVCGVGDKELREAMLDRINFMLSIAEEHGVQTLILGAWGCGVFEWNPEIVAELFMEVKGRYNIPNIIFAIPGLFEYNYMVFNRVLS